MTDCLKFYINTKHFVTLINSLSAGTEFWRPLQRVLIQMRRHRTWRLIRIQTVCYSDSILWKKNHVSLTKILMIIVLYVWYHFFVILDSFWSNLISYLSSFKLVIFFKWYTFYIGSLALISNMGEVIRQTPVSCKNTLFMYKCL